MIFNRGQIGLPLFIALAFPTAKRTAGVSSPFRHVQVTEPKGSNGANAGETCGGLDQKISQMSVTLENLSLAEFA
ncbi:MULTISPECIES: hypothetical protein [unclassified Bradyrhizobium]|uniref:hypothetical protein n=1 Tax=unclassified Bradyrhizobium TaxID=2631580 RepID=UPI002FEEC273